MDHHCALDLEELLVRVVTMFTRFGNISEHQLQEVTWDDYWTVSAVRHDAGAQLKKTKLISLRRILRRTLKTLKRSVRESLAERNIPDPYKRLTKSD